MASANTTLLDGRGGDGVERRFAGASCARYSPSGSHLAIGCKNGSLVVLAVDDESSSSPSAAAAAAVVPHPSLARGVRLDRENIVSADCVFVFSSLSFLPTMMYRLRYVYVRLCHLFCQANMGGICARTLVGRHGGTFLPLTAGVPILSKKMVDSASIWLTVHALWVS